MLRPGVRFVLTGVVLCIGFGLAAGFENPCDAPGDTIWTRRYNGPSNLGDYASAISVDASGNVYVTGRSASSTGSMDDYITIRYRPSGDTAWVRRYDGNCPVAGARNDRAVAIALDATGYVYVTGSSFSNLSGRTTADYLTIKYNPTTGDTVWTRRYTGPDNKGDDVPAAIAVKGNAVYVTGQSYGDSATTRLDYATLKYDLYGNLQWERRYDGGVAPSSNSDIATALVVDDSGNVYVTGYSVQTINPCDYVTIRYDANGAQRWIWAYNGPANSEDRAMAIAFDNSSRSVYVTGYSYGTVNQDYLTIRYDAPTGTPMWVRRFDGQGIDMAAAITTDGSGGICVTGASDSASAPDYLTIKYSTQGDSLWVTRYDGPGHYSDRASAIVAGPDGGVFVTGASFSSPSTGDYATIKYDVSGNAQWVARYNGSANLDDRASAIAADNANHVYVTGYSHTAGSAEDYLTIKYDDAPQHDVGVLRILAPLGTVDSGATVPPQAWLRNYGQFTETFMTQFRIGTDYVDSATTTLPAGDSVLKSFPLATPRTRGMQPIKCSTRLATDANPGNNRKIDSIFVRVIDAEAVSIIAPVGTIDSGATITPQANIRNNGTASATFDVTFSIGAWNNTQAVTLAGGASQAVSFGSWIATQRGSTATKCTTKLAGDLVQANNVKIGTVLVRVLDAEVVSIAAPTGSVDSGATVTPQANVRNNGTVGVTFDVVFSIGTWTSTRSVTVASGATQLVNFDPWSASQRGSFTAKCTTKLAGDIVPANNVRVGNFTVAVHDIGAVTILAPVGTILPGAVTPRVRVHNYGTGREPCTATFTINSSPPYAQTLNVPGGFPVGSDTTANFPAWSAVLGSYIARCSTYLTTDQRRSNDTLSSSFTVESSVIDVGVTSIVWPIGSLESSSAVVPHVVVGNLGSAPASFSVRFRFDTSHVSVYRDSVSVADLASGETTSVFFREWPKPHPFGQYVACCSTWIAGDVNPVNDTLSGRFTVVPSPRELGWCPLSGLPPGPKNRRVKDGCCLAALNQSDRSDLPDGPDIYCLKGNNTCEFYRYNTAANVWETKESIPAFGVSARKKAVKKGASMTRADGRIYAVKGNNTLEFWSYDPSYSSDRSELSYPWVQLPDIPSGARAVKEGSGLTAVRVGETTWVYFLKGSGTTEFYSYSLFGNRWESRASAPVGASGRNFKNGSCITSDGNRTVYALKGSYNELFAYDVATSSWTTLTALPFIGSSGRKRKAKDGAALAYRQGWLYALKGGNTREFWAYPLDSSRWFQKDDMPIGGGKNVKGGGAAVYAPVRDAMLATKGNNTTEFWMYDFQVGGAPSRMRGSQFVTQSGIRVTPSPRFALSAAPNPFRDATKVSYSIPTSSAACLKLYDVSGKLIMTMANGYHTAGDYVLVVTRERLAGGGVHLLRLQTKSLNATRKLIVE